MTNNDIISKVQKLLALAENNSNQHEAENALLMAHKLIAQYNLDWNIQEKINTEINFDLIEIAQGKNIINWKANLYHILAKYNFYKVVISRGNASIYLYGRKQNRELVTLLYNNLCSQIEKISEKEFQLYKLCDGKVHGKTWKASFCLGVVSGYASKLELQQKEMNNNPEYMAVISLDKKLVEEEIAKRWSKLSKGTAISINTTIYNDGVKTGKNLNAQKLLGN